MNTPDSMITVVTAHGLGDTHIVAGLCHALKEKWPGFQITLICKPEHQDLARMFPGIDCIASWDPRSWGPNEFAHPTPGKVFYAHPSVAPIRGDFCVAHRPMSDVAMYAMILGLDPDTQLARPSWSERGIAEAKFLADDFKHITGRKVLLVPHANSWPNVPMDFWTNLRNALTDAGFYVFWNEHKTLPLRMVFPFLEHIGWVIGANCGFMQIAVCGQLKCKKTVLHQALNGNKLGLPITSDALYANVRKIDGHKYDIEEFRIDGPETWENRIQDILTGRNALGGEPIITPLTVIESEIAPGEVLDRLSILYIKHARLPDKAYLLKREIALLTEIRERLVSQYPVVVQFEQELMRLNLLAWDNNQILIEQFVDGYGAGEWSLDHNGLADPLDKDITKAERVIKAFHNAHWSNRTRIRIKNKIDEMCHAGVREEKSYAT